MAQQTRLMQQALADQVAAVPQGQADLAVWDEALAAVDAHDTKWFNDNIGASGFNYYNQSRIFILDGDLKPVYAMRDGGQVPATAFDTVRTAIDPLVVHLRTIDSQAAIDAYNNGSGQMPPSATDILMLEGRPAIVSAMPLLSHSGEAISDPGTEPVYVAATMLDDALAAELTRQYLFENAHFHDQPETTGSEVALPVKNSAGDTITYLKWEPDRPGSRILNDTLPALLGALVVAGLIIAVLLRNLQRASAELQAERADAQHRALHDPLTGLGNRTLFHDRLGQALRDMPRGEPRVALLALDLDRFKQVNDTLGHEAGDELLRQVATRIRNLLRSEDTLVRLGGDEFAIIQPAIASWTEPSTLAQRIIDTMGAPFHIAGTTAEIGISIGIATAPDLAQTDAQLVTRADDALYQAKAGGRNRFCLHANAELPAGHPVQLEEQVRDAFSKRGAA